MNNLNQVTWKKSGEETKKKLENLCVIQPP